MEFFRKKSSPVVYVPLLIVDMCRGVVFPDFELGGVGREGGGERVGIVDSLGDGKTLET